ncbi:MAG: DUF4276 family protein [Deltaproteobacteria bacterium]|nr:DUF4276 family protein [Deltaproteobacteria bacterium]
MVEFLLCVEGGGDSSLLKTHCREGFRKFIKNSSYTGPMPRIAACGNRQAAYDDFTISLAQGQKAFLLVDSEDPVAESNQGKPWEHLAAREGDKWTKPTGATDGDCHLMVVCMESWFLSDRETLKKFFGQDFHENSLPSVETPLESIPKAKVYDSLKKATGECAIKNAYSKSETLSRY